MNFIQNHLQSALSFGLVGSTAAAFFVAALVGLWPRPAAALDDVCARSTEASEPTRGSLREKASRFAPTVELRLWMRPDDRLQERQRALPAAVTAAPAPTDAPDRTYVEVDRPFGWQIRFQWDVVRMLQVARTANWQLEERLEPTGCRRLDLRRPLDLSSEYDGGTRP